MTYDGLPASITVDGIAYAVVVDPNLDSDGEYSSRECKIKIRPGMALPYARAVISHEWTHALYEHGGLTAEDIKLTEETVVSSMGYRLLESLRANPQLLAFLTAP